MPRLKIRAEKREIEARECLENRRRMMDDSGYLTYVQRLEAFDQQYRMKMQRTEPPWPNASTYNPPITFSKIEDIHAILFGLLANFNFFAIAASEGRGLAEDLLKERARKLNDYLKWSMQNESNTIPFLDQFVHTALLFGHSFGYVGWLTQKRMSRSELFLPPEIRKLEKAKDRDIVVVALAEALRGKPKEVGEGRFAVEFIDEDGEEKEGFAVVDREGPFRPKDEIAVILEREVTVYNAPKPDPIMPWDIVVPPTARSVQSARSIYQNQWYTYDDVARLAKIGLFNVVSRDELALLRRKSDMDPQALSSGSASEATDVEASRDIDFGVSLLEDRRSMFHVVYQYAFEDIDGDGFTESIVRAVLDLSGGKPILLMRQPVEYIYPSGRRPFFDWGMLPVRGRYYCMGIAELIENTQVEANAFYQNRSDVIELVTKPCGFYSPMSGLAPNVIKLRPGQLLKVSDPPRAFAPLAFPIDPGLLLREQSMAEVHAERAVGSTEMGLGRMPSRNPPRTLGATAMLVRQQQLRMDVLASRLMYGIGEGTGGVSEFLMQYLDLLQTFTPEGKEFRVMGTDELCKVQRSEIQGRYDFVIDIGQELNNPQLRMQNAALRYQYGMSNPLVVQNPNTLWRVTVDFFEATGWKNASRLIPPPGPVDAHPPMTQDEENSILARGLYIDALPSDNHTEHLTNIALLLANPAAMAEKFGPTQVQLLNRHAQKHFEYQQMAQMAMGGGMPQLGPGGNGGAQQRGPRVQASMGSGESRLREPMAGPIEMELERGLQ